MAGAVKLKKRIYSAIHTVCVSIRDGIVEGSLSVEEADEKETELKRLFTQYQEAADIVKETHSYWKETEKLAKLQKEVTEIEDMVRFNFQALSRYVLTTMHSVHRLQVDVDATLREASPGSVLHKSDLVVTDTTGEVSGGPVTTVKKPVIAPKPSILKTPITQAPEMDIVSKLRTQLQELETTRTRITESLAAVDKLTGKKDPVVQQLHFNDKKHVFTPDVFSTPKDALDLREDDQDSSFTSDHIYINEDVDHKGDIASGKLRFPFHVPPVPPEPMRDRHVLSRVDRDRRDAGSDHYMLHDTLSEYIESGRKPQPLRTRGRMDDDSGLDDSTKYLTRIPLPKYNGDKRNFGSWWAAFNAVVDNAPVSDSIKMLKLYESVTGPALDAIKDLGFSQMSYTMAKEKLERKFGGERRKMALRCEELLEFKPMKEDTAEELEKLSELLDRLVLSLYENNDNSELGSGTLYHTLLKKLTANCCSKYQRWVFEHMKVANVLSLREFINQESMFMVGAAEAVKGLSSNPKKSHKSGNTGRSFATAEAGTKRDQGTGKYQGRNKRDGGPGVGTSASVKSSSVDQKSRPKSSRKWKCKVCPGEHSLWECARYLNMSVDDKWDTVEKVSACYKCLQYAHGSDTCYRKRGCTVADCPKAHHYTLHGERKRGDRKEIGDKVLSSDRSLDKKETTPPTASGLSAGTSDQTDVKHIDANTHASGVKVHGNTVMFRTVPIILKSDTRKIRINALLDEASDRSYISDDVANYLHLSGEEVRMTVNTVNNTTSVVPSQEVICELISDAGDLSCLFSARTLPSISTNLRACKLNKKKQQWKHLQDIPFPEYAGGHIDALIGIDYARLMKSCGNDIEGDEPGAPLARKTPLGWTCIGMADRSEQADTLVANTFFISEESRLDAMVRRFWEMDSLPSETEPPRIMTREEKVTVQQVTDSITVKDGRYCVGIPWRDGRPHGINNFVQALKRLDSLWKRFMKEKDLRLYYEYQKVIDEYIAKGYMTEIPLSSIHDESCWFLPHFPVVRQHVETTKVRMVKDASAEFDGISLNSLIHVGPKLQKDILTILLRFRRYPVGLSSDVAQMYMQIEVVEEDRPFQRILWYGPDGKLRVYQFNRVVFGLNVSPFLAQFVAQQNSERFKETHPDGYTMVRDSTYMDDGLDSKPNDERAKQTIKEVKEIWAGCSMNVHKWLSNSRDALSILPKDELGKKVDLSKHDLPQSKAVGQGWNPQTDELNYEVTINGVENIKTKRTFLSTLASIFDPMGLACPILIRGKILLQRIWERGVDWDDPLPQDLIRSVHDWLMDVSHLNSFKVARVLVKLENAQLEIHIFADASGAAYGAVIYVKNWIKDQSPWINIVLAKAKVAPLTTVSTPRLELMAAVVGVRASEIVKTVLQVSSDRCFYWTDSQDVMYWVHGHSRDWKPFVANRVGEIQQYTEPSNWRYVETAKNPADLLSRGVSGDRLINDDFWRKGPDFLCQEKIEWPTWKMPLSDKAEREKKKYCVSTFVVKDETKEAVLVFRSGVRLEEIGMGPEKFSSWQRLTEVLAYVMRAILCFKHKSQGKEKILSIDEIIDAERLLICYSQHASYKKEIRALQIGKTMDGSSEIKSMNPWLDEDGVLRGRARTEKSESLPWDVRFPILLSREDYVTFLIARSVHEKLLHTGPNSVATELQQRYWIPGIRILAKHVETECLKCRRRKARPLQPFMGPLPADRVNTERQVFGTMATDFAGPFYTKAGRGRAKHKRYMCLFTCVHTRAVHLEMVYDMSTSGFLLALIRFMDRRGKPTIAYSDHGSNYVGGNNEMREVERFLDEELLKEKTKVHKITWKFNPPAAPHFSGVHEALIKSAKKGIYSVLSGADITDEELHTIMTDVEAMLNSRPITVLNSDAEDLQPLTPLQFLTGRMYIPMAHELYSFEEDLKNRWRHVEKLSGQIWRRWMREWLTMLSPRSKWVKHCRDLKIGDVVLIVDPATPRCRWRLGKILTTFPGSDGIVRVVDVQVGDTVYRRPAVKLSFLTD